MLKLEMRPASSVLPPGKKVRVGLCWDHGKRKRKVSFQLFLLWFTEGIGNTDVGIVAGESFETRDPIGEKEFFFTLPISPESFQGSLITLRWAIEARSDRGETVRVEFDLSRRPTPMRIPRVTDEVEEMPPPER